MLAEEEKYLSCSSTKLKWRWPVGVSLLSLCTSLNVFPMQRNPIALLHNDFAHRRSMMSWLQWLQPLFGPHSLSMNPSERRATAGGLKNQLSSPPSAATIGAAARRLGKVWQLKSFQGSVKHRPALVCKNKNYFYYHQFDVLNPA